MARQKRNQVFISYSQKDKNWLRLIKEALVPYTRKNELDIWDDTRIKAGDKWRDEITAALKRASVAVMLVSRNFLASTFIAEVELPTFLDAAEKEGLRIIWIAVGDCALETTSLKDYQAANDPAYPLNSLDTADLDKALAQIARTVVEAAHPNDLPDPQVRRRSWNRIIPAVPLQLIRQWPRVAAASGLLVLAALLWGGFWLTKKSQKPIEQITILIADFDGPEDYKVTQAVLARMRESVQNKIPNVRIVPLAHKITEQDGPEKALEEGRKADANLVLWGYYNTSYRGRVHIEQIKTPERLHLLKGSFDLNPPIAERQGLTVEEDLSSELNYLVLVITGLTRFEVGDYGAAIDCYDGALKERSAPEQLLDQVEIYYFRGQAFLYLDADESLDHYRAGSSGGGSDRFYLGGDAPNDNPYFLDQAISNFTTVIKARPSDVSALSERAYGYAKKGDYSSALSDYDRVVKDFPSYAEAHMGRGIVHNLMKEYDQAIADYNQSESLEQNNAELYYNRAISFEQKSDYEHALADYNHAISINRDDVDSKINRASLYAHLGYGDKAVVELTRTFDGIPPTAFYYLRRGQAWAEIGDDDKALSDFSSLISLAPDSTFGYHHRGHLFRDLRRFDEAITDFSKVASLDPKAGYARNDLATCWISKGNFAEALKSYSEATEIDPKWGFSWVNRGLALWHTRENQQAIFCLTKGTEIDFEERYMAYYYLAQVKSDEADYMGAIEDYASAIQLNPGFVNLWLKKAALWIKVERYDSAMRDYRTAFTFLEALADRSEGSDAKGTYDAAVGDLTEALKHNPRNKDGYIARCLAYLLGGRNEDALKDITVALDLNRNSEGLLFQGIVLSKLKKYAEAETSFDKAIALDARSARAFYSRAMAYADDKQLARAIDDLTQVLALAPTDSVARINRGTCYALQKDFVRAIADFDNVPADSPKYDLALLFRGLAKSDLGNREAAKEDLKRASHLARTSEVRNKAAAELVRLGASPGSVDLAN